LSRPGSWATASRSSSTKPCAQGELERRVCMRSGVIGAGSMGRTLARHLTKRGHHVSMANARGPETLTALAAEIGATPVAVVDAATAGDMVIIAIPTKAVPDLPEAL